MGLVVDWYEGREPPPSVVHGWLVKWRATLSGNEEMRAKGMDEMARAKQARTYASKYRGHSHKPSPFGLGAQKESDRRKNYLQKHGLSRRHSLFGLNIPDLLSRETRRPDPPRRKSTSSTVKSSRHAREAIGSNWTLLSKAKPVPTANPPRPSRRSTDPGKHRTKGTSTRKDSPLPSPTARRPKISSQTRHSSNKHRKRSAKP